MKTKSRSFITAAAAIAIGIDGSAFAANYHYGSVAEDFTIRLGDMASAQGVGTGTGSFISNTFGAVYDRGADQDATYMHFNLSLLEGTTMNGDVNLNLTVNDQYGGGLYGGIIGTAAAAWTAIPGSAVPGITTFTPVSAPADGVYTTGQTATWTIDNSTFSGIIENLGTFNGLAITAGDGSQAHFTYAATLTGSYNPGEIRVIDGTDWSAASWDNGSKTLTIAGASDVSGGNVTLVAGTTLAVGDTATLGGGSFSGTIANNGSLILGSSADQTLGGSISGTGSVTVNSGTLNITKANDNLTTSGGLTINNGGTVVLKNYNPMGSASVTLPVTIDSGGLMTMNAGWSVHLGPLTLNGGDLSSGGVFHPLYGSYYLDGDVTVKAGASTISAMNIISGGVRNFDVEAGGTLNVTGGFSKLYSGAFALTKSGDGTMVLSGANDYTGATTVNGGTLSLSSAYLDDASTVSIASGAVLNLTHGLTDMVGSLIIDGTPLADGIYTADSPETSGYITGTGSIQVGASPAETFDTWMSANYPGIVSPENQPSADPDNDGVSNLVEYLLKDGDPSSSNPGILPTLNAAGTDFVFTFFRRTAAVGITQVFEFSSTLDTGSWTSIAIPGGAGVTVTDQLDGSEKVEIKVAKGSTSKLFGRIKVTR